MIIKSIEKEKTMSQQKWNSRDVPDQRGRVAIVTGSSSGIGYETARVLAAKNATVIFAVRNLEKGQSALEKIKTGLPDADMKIIELDLANLDSVRRFAEEFKKSYSQLDLLINNAGVMMPPYSKTADGFELQFGTNHLGHFALTALLLDLILKTENSRIVTVSSGAHGSGKLDFDDLNWEKRKYKKMRTYADSKIANLYFTYVLQEKLEKAGSKTIAVVSHPGWTGTDLQRHVGLFKFLNRFFSQGIDMGALPTLYAATAPDVKGSDYYGPSGWKEMKGYPTKVDSNELSHDKDIAKQLWEVSEELTKVKFFF
jgi:NAD(P)-dependent dehydrogenase (short-subunit alcohol dehydrogenase family)